ncbi:MAG: OadG family transporter subunit [Oscillospiraceae bacterium]
MSLALSFLSAAGTSEAVAAVESVADAAKSGSVIDELQSFVEHDGITIAEQQLAHPDYWSSVGIITITGVLVVFIILAVLILFFSIMGMIFKAIDKSKAAKAQALKEKNAEPVKTEAPIVENVAEEDDFSDDDEVIAVISAAIAAYSAQDGKSYEIRSIKRKDGRTRSAWSLAGIGENTRPF